MYKRTLIEWVRPIRSPTAVSTIVTAPLSELQQHHRDQWMLWECFTGFILRSSEHSKIRYCWRVKNALNALEKNYKHRWIDVQRQFVWIFLLPLLLYTNTRYSWSTYTWLKMHRRFLLCHDKGHNLSAADHVTKSHQHSAWRLPSSDSLGISTVKRTLAIKNHKRK